MTKRTWNAGKPPHVGWWNASIVGDTEAWRWWDGRQWSRVCYPHETLREVAARASQKFDKGSSALVKWTHAWPINARTERKAP